MRWILNFAREQDASRASPEDRGTLGELLELGEESVLIEELEHGGGFATGHDQAVDTREVGHSTNHAGADAEGCEHPHVGVVGPLEGEDADEQIIARIVNCSAGQVGLPAPGLHQVALLDGGGGETLHGAGHGFRSLGHNSCIGEMRSR